MPELRKDPIVGRWVIISTERGKRPTSFKMNEKPAVAGGFCPLCPENEDKTPPEVYALRRDGSKPNTPGWTLRVVSNKFPALVIEGSLKKQAEGMYDKMNGIGAHEVIIETARHGSSLCQLNPKAFEDVLWTYRERIVDLQKDVRFRYVLIFKNHGVEAGASLAHSHSQLIALPIIPKLVMEEMEGSKNYYRYKDRCVFCDIVHQELDDKIRVVVENDDFLAITPFASRSPFEIWLLPKKHSSSFVNISPAEYSSLARIFKDVLSRLEAALEDPPYNFTLHTSPFNELINDYYHWHFEIIPTLSKIAGFEIGSGFYINPTPPEEAATFLKEIK
ncbi:MAG: galactose-1-phosphate uridylyltransferase [Thermodesulfobacteriota bacterium]|jgi:UDPglucose--hexose-1-phosphate uridylyltransferase|nr:MAG: galactose-1-phosphate uridylyltransferase [Thermodesulfobacteriota bacterium]